MDTDTLRPLEFKRITAWIDAELTRRDSIFGIAHTDFFVPSANDPFRCEYLGRRLATPVGPAAGPHTQMTQNIVCAWLCGARFFELKTVQTLDDLKVSRPCIDVKQEGYNCEWSQELKLKESFVQYLQAWVLIHALHRRLGFCGDTPEIIFNMSVGYDLEGIQRENIQTYLANMLDATEMKERLVGEAAEYFPEIHEIDVPSTVSDNVTLSTMHGCPPDEIERIAEYLLVEKGLHTHIKLNPVLLGSERVRSIIDGLGYNLIKIADSAFEEDLLFDDAVGLIARLRGVATVANLHFGVKLCNTLQVENFRDVFDPAEKSMYLSGPPLFAIATNLARRLSLASKGLSLSYSAGVDAESVASLLAAGFLPVTVCTDLLKTHGYARLPGYLEKIATAMHALGAGNLEEFICATASEAGDVDSCAAANLHVLANGAPVDEAFMSKGQSKTMRKSKRELGMFDCPGKCGNCVGVCPNRAMIRYEIDAADLEKLPIAIEKTSQVFVFNDLCNECGNCVTFCPTAGRPFHDKPRLFTDERVFNEQKENAFLFLSIDGHPAMRARLGGGEHELVVADCLLYTAVTGRSVLDVKDFTVLEGDPLSVEELGICARLYVLIRGVERRMEGAFR